MMFENELTSTPSLRSQVVRHLPIALMIGGLLIGAVAMHLAALGVVAFGLGHVLIGAAVFAIRRHRSETS